MNTADGNTAIQVSPIPTESEMNGFRQMLDRALNAVIQASELAKVVDNLKIEVAQFSQDITNLRKHNQDLDDMLTHVRGQRDKAESDLSVAQGKATEIASSLNQALNKIAELDDDNSKLRAELESVKRERDTAHDEWYKADASAGEAKSKLADIQEFAQRLFPTKPQAIVEPIVPSPVLEAHPLTVSDIQEVPAQAAVDIWEGVDRNKPYHWDLPNQKYIND